MKSISFRSAFIVLLFSSLAWSCTNKNAPTEIAKVWLNDYHELNFEDAKKYSTETTRNTLSLAQMFLSTMPDSLKRKAREIKVNIKGSKEDGSNATVVYTLSRDPNREEKLNLVKQGDTWLVQFTKNDMNVEGGMPDTTAAPAGADSNAVQITVGPPDTANTAPIVDTGAH